MTWQLVLVGLGLGLVVGLTGVGGGSLMTPILIIFFGFSAKVAIGTDIFHSAVFKTFGAWRHRRLGTVHGHLALWLFAGSGPLAIVGVWLSWYLQDSLENPESILKVILGVALILGGVGFLAKSFITRGPETSDGPFIMSHRDKVIAVITGAVFGFVVGLTSVGSGTFFGLVMVLVYPLTMSKIVGTDIFHAAALLWVAGIGHAFIGDIDWHAVGWLLIGSIPGILISSRWAVRVPQLTIRLGLGGVLVISGINLVDVDKSLPSWIFASLLGTLAVSVLTYTFVAMRGPRPAPEQA
ncbi:MAG: uncharacterized protein QOG85_2703 [Gaiellaceae bacterium]|jgi:uncharacterized membrane protein YfcA|nr:uncharacterized protein [Gaiellaceae bacterium]